LYIIWAFLGSPSSIYRRIKGSGKKDILSQGYTVEGEEPGFEVNSISFQSP
jgi:hypothetical protein